MDGALWEETACRRCCKAGQACKHDTSCNGIGNLPTPGRLVTPPPRQEGNCSASMRAEHPRLGYMRSCWTSFDIPQIHERLLPYRIPVALTAVRCSDKPAGEISLALRFAHRYRRLDKLSPKAAAASECHQVRLCCLSVRRSYWEYICGDLCRFAQRHRQVAVQL